MKKPDAILTADWHIRADKPRSRTDDFTAVMWSKIQFILDLADHHKIPILLAGDLGQRSQWPNWLIEKFMSMVHAYGINIFAIPGQHDLPEHSLDLLPKSGIGVLYESGTIWKIKTHIEPEIGFESMYTMKPLGIGMAHRMTIEDKPEWPGQVADSGKATLKGYPQYKTILTGDNHKPFVVKYRNRILVNPGSLMRTTAAQIDHKPRIYLWKQETNEVEAVYLPIVDGVIDRSHIDQTNERDTRIEAYTTRLSERYEVGMSFKQNLINHFKANRSRQPVKERVWQACEK